jgi:hypothetical protein
VHSYGNAQCVEDAMAHGRNARLATLLLGLAFAAMPANADPRPVVVELFTSQGCSSCPPADAFLGELARRGDVLALGFHISYWDSLGWKDPLSSPSSTERQKAYARHFTDGRIYTPQMVVDGTDEMIGSDRAAVLAAIGDARPEAIAPVSFAADRRAVAIGSGAGNGKIVLLRFVQHRTTDVGAGENSGRRADDFNGVKTLAMLGAWDGSRLEFAIEPPAAGEGLAVLVQAPDGHMLGAAMVLGSG